MPTVHQPAAAPAAEIAPETLHKEQALLRRLRDLDSVVVAYSGGVDSTYLADVAGEALGDRAQLILFDSPALARCEVAQAVKLAKTRGWNLHVIPSSEFEIQAFLNNDAQRCYYCRRERFALMAQSARSSGVRAVLHGQNADDLAAGESTPPSNPQGCDTIAPLAEAGLGKQEIRALSRVRGLPTWAKPSSAGLSARFPSGEPRGISDVHRMEQAEQALRDLQIHSFGLQSHGDLCRIELSAGDFQRLCDGDERRRLVAAVRAAGFAYVAVDLSAPEESPALAGEGAS